MSDPIFKQRALVAALTQDRVQWTIEHRTLLRLLKDRQPIPPDTNQSILKDVHLFLALLTFVLNETENGDVTSALSASKENIQ